MEYTINLYFPFNGNTDHIIVSENNPLDDIREYIFEGYNIEDFKVVLNNVEITKNDFHLTDDMTLSIIPSMKSGKNITYHQINFKPNQVLKIKCTCQYCKNNIPNKRPYISPPEIPQKYIRNFDREELENLGKKYRIAMEEEIKREDERRKENQKTHEKIMELRDKIRKFKAKHKKRINGIIEEPKKPEQDNYCGFKKGFLL